MDAASAHEGKNVSARQGNLATSSLSRLLLARLKEVILSTCFCNVVLLSSNSSCTDSASLSGLPVTRNTCVWLCVLCASWYAWWPWWAWWVWYATPLYAWWPSGPAAVNRGIDAVNAYSFSCPSPPCQACAAREACEDPGDYLQLLPRPCVWPLPLRDIWCEAGNCGIVAAKLCPLAPCHAPLACACARVCGGAAAPCMVRFRGDRGKLFSSVSGVGVLQPPFNIDNQGGERKFIYGC